MATLAQPQQPDLRAFVVYGHVPDGCIAHLVTNNDSAPLLHPGDVVLIDTDQRDPIHDDLFLIEYGKGTPQPKKHIVEVMLRSGRYGYGAERPGEYYDGVAWFTGAYARPRSYEEYMRRVRAGTAIHGGCMIDGPVSNDEGGNAYMRDRLVGRVVGLLEVANAGLRQIGRAA
ncbi:hypothetical protein D9601_10290 [Sphingomonas sp. MA1305]|uniref:hypothetical protein n=1 Tax=Sphingomonas sp. MA1305 TaxID=2479204 RepID=UPI0018DF2BA9|nr:hypothetical protein [Sphingomonas sp. MA1305]MBI0475740.1 hypothetical protein [Sphingomonas sp. MA1305]